MLIHVFMAFLFVKFLGLYILFYFEILLILIKYIYSALPEDEWFVDTAKSAINKLMLGTSGSETSELDEHIILHDESSDFDETPLSPSSIESVDSFASANTGVIESPTDLTEPEA